ncbi:hypothetical protein [Helicobacter rodentium]|nr:hypothetical protein [Helicobacter rodentium]
MIFSPNIQRQMPFLVSIKRDTMTISKNISSLTKITDILHKIRGGGAEA